MLKTCLKPLLTASPGSRMPFGTSEVGISTCIGASKSEPRLTVCKGKLAAKSDPRRCDL